MCSQTTEALGLLIFRLFIVYYVRLFSYTDERNGGCQNNYASHFGEKVLDKSN
jgi:hypothetical protein